LSAGAALYSKAYAVVYKFEDGERGLQANENCHPFAHFLKKSRGQSDGVAVVRLANYSLGAFPM
jgi:hypothetical protein